MRLLLEGIKIAFRALLSNKLRTLLTLLGNIVGIMSVIAVVSLLGGIDEYMRQEVAAEGSNVFTIFRVNFFDAITDYDGFVRAMKYNPRLEREDATVLRRDVTSALHVSARASTQANVSFQNRVVKNIEVRGRDFAYPFVDSYELSPGSYGGEEKDLCLRLLDAG